MEIDNSEKLEEKITTEYGLQHNSISDKKLLEDRLQHALHKNFESSCFYDGLGYFKCKNQESCEENHKEYMGKEINLEESDSIENRIRHNWVSLDSYIKNWVSHNIYLPWQIIGKILYSLPELNKDEILFNSILQSVRRHIAFHTPCNVKLKQYYLSLLTETQASEDVMKKGRMAILPYVLKNIQSKYENVKKIQNDNPGCLEFEKPFVPLPYTEENFNLLLLELPRRITYPYKCGENSELARERRKLNNFCSILGIINDIFEQDLIIFKSKHDNVLPLKASEEQPLISHVYWNSKRVIGATNKQIKNVFMLLTITSAVYRNEILRHISLLAEVVRLCDGKITNFPYYGKTSVKFANEFSASIKDGLKSSTDIIDVIRNITPFWLQLLVCDGFFHVRKHCPGSDLTLKTIVFCFQSYLTNDKSSKIEDLLEPDSSGADPIDNIELLINYVKANKVDETADFLNKGAATLVWSKNEKGLCAVDACRIKMKAILQTSYKQAVKSFNIIRMSEAKLNVFYIMLLAYVSFYKIKIFYTSQKYPAITVESKVQVDMSNFLNDQYYLYELYTILERLHEQYEDSYSFKCLYIALKCILNKRN